MRRNLAIISFILLAVCIGIIAKTVVKKSNNLNSKGTASTSESAAGGYVNFTGALDGTPAADGDKWWKAAPLAEEKGVDLFELAGVNPNEVSTHLDRDDLDSIDRWRYDRCLSDAADKPTEQGVNVALYLCKEKFLRKNTESKP